MEKRFIIPIFITNLGCKNKCIFCNQSKIAGDSIKPEDLSKIVNLYISTQLQKFGKINPKYKEKQISFYGGSFTCLKKSLMFNYLKKAFQFIENNIIDSLRLSTRPDCIDEEILSYLKEFKVKTIEIGAQSFNDRLLKILKRGHSLFDIKNAVTLIKNKGFELGIQLLVGKPEETFEVFKEEVNILIKLKPNFIRIYPLIVLQNTELERMYKMGQFYPISVKEAIKRSAYLYKRCRKEGIKVIRIGLPYSEDLIKGIIAGPYHVEMGNLVKKYLEEKVNEN